MTWLIDYQITLQLMFLWSINRLIVAVCSTILYTVLLILLVCNIFFLWVTLLWRWHFSSCKISPETEEFSIQFVKDFNVTFLVFIPLFVKAFKTDGLSAVLQDTPSQESSWMKAAEARQGCWYRMTGEGVTVYSHPVRKYCNISSLSQSGLLFLLLSDTLESHWHTVTVAERVQSTAI